MNNINQWELERQRAWTAFVVAQLAHGYTDNLENIADKFMKEWESRFPKPQEKSE